MVAIAARPPASRSLIIPVMLLVSVACWMDDQQRNQCQSVASPVSRLAQSLPEQRAQTAKVQEKGASENTATDAKSNIGIVGFKFVLEPNKEPLINVVFPDTPAAKAHLQKGDRILAVDGVPTHGFDKEEIYQMVVGEPDTVVTISILRGTDTLKEKALVRTALKKYKKLNPAMWRNYMLNM